MTVLEEDVPYMCIYKISNGPIVTVCDVQCTSCKNAQNTKIAKND